MKKLEKMDGKLFESLKPNEMSNLAAFVGGKNEETHANDPALHDSCFTSSLKGSADQILSDFTSWCDDSCTKDVDERLNPNVSLTDVVAVADTSVSL